MACIPFAPGWTREILTEGSGLPVVPLITVPSIAPKSDDGNQKRMQDAGLMPFPFRTRRRISWVWGKSRCNADTRFRV